MHTISIFAKLRHSLCTAMAARSTVHPENENRHPIKTPWNLAITVDESYPKTAR
jgi:hypothetical protein